MIVEKCAMKTDFSGVDGYRKLAFELSTNLVLHSRLDNQEAVWLKRSDFPTRLLRFLPG